MVVVVVAAVAVVVVGSSSSSNSSSSGRCEIPNCQLGQSLPGGGRGRGLTVDNHDDDDNDVGDDNDDGDEDDDDDDDQEREDLMSETFPLLSLPPSRICPWLTLYLSEWGSRYFVVRSQSGHLSTELAAKEQFKRLHLKTTKKEQTFVQIVVRYI